jgi:NADH-quinone oxidoreductase subunit L
MLENAWIIPLIPAASFFLILLFGKRFPRQGSEIGIAALGICFVLAIVTNVQWFQHVDDAEHDATEHSEETDHADEEGDDAEHGLAPALSDGESAAPLLPAAVSTRTAPGAEEEHASFTVEPFQKTWTWWSNGGIDFTVGMLLDGPGVMMLFVVTLISLLVHIYSTD